MIEKVKHKEKEEGIYMWAGRKKNYEFKEDS